jgi:hypothetical protein
LINAAYARANKRRRVTQASASKDVTNKAIVEGSGTLTLTLTLSIPM